MTITILTGCCLAQLATLPDKSYGMALIPYD